MIKYGVQELAKKVEVYCQLLLQKQSGDENEVALFNYPVKPLGMKIPWAFPEGSVEKAKAELRQKLHEAIVSSEKNE